MESHGLGAIAGICEQMGLDGRRGDDTMFELLEIRKGRATAGQSSWTWGDLGRSSIELDILLALGLRGPLD